MEIKLQYMGSRPDIKPIGITFKTGKEDKYVYINYAIDILRGLENSNDSYEYIHQTNQKIFSDDEIYEFIRVCEADVKKNIEQEIQSYENRLAIQIKQINNQKRFQAIEKYAFIENLKIMKPYKIQRAINKIVYMHIIEAIIKLVKNKKIKKIQTVFCEKYWHILHTIEGHIFTSTNGLNAQYLIKEDKNKKSMTIELKFSHFA